MFVLSSNESLSQLRQQADSIRHAAVVGFSGVSLADLTLCAHLETLEISGFYHTGTSPDWCDTISDFSPLAFLPALRRLSIHDCSHFDESQLAIVSKIPRLETLSVTTFIPTILRFDAALFARNLSKLQLNFVSDLAFLSGLSSLRHLFVSDKWSPLPLSNLEALSGLLDLKTLTINSRNHRTVSVNSGCLVEFCHGHYCDEYEWWNAMLKECG